jgi:hypothetical protein
MNTAELIYEKSKHLPDNVTAQILDFVECLESKQHQKKESVMKHLQESIAKNHLLGELLAK